MVGFEPPILGLLVKWFTTALAKSPLFFYLFGILYLLMTAAWLGLRTKTKSNMLPLCYWYGLWKYISLFSSLVGFEPPTLGLWVKWSITVLTPQAINFFLLFSLFFISCRLYYKHMMIVNDDSSIISKWSSKFIDDYGVIIYDRKMFTIQATGDNGRIWNLSSKIEPSVLPQCNNHG